MSSTMWYIMQSIQSKYSLSERLIRTIAAIRSFPHDNVEDLIRKGADVNRMHGTLKPLHCACMVADADCVELLLEKVHSTSFGTFCLYLVACRTRLSFHIIWLPFPY
uniref:Ankyrin repeat and SOCS box containing 8 n=1 Tax=Cyclopterus lumpus TaxID=8103 RepID=A0A8C2ZUL0_CYCLU